MIFKEFSKSEVNLPNSQILELEQVHTIEQENEQFFRRKCKVPQEFSKTFNLCTFLQDFG